MKAINNVRRRDNHRVRATQLTANPIQNISHTVSFILFFFYFVRFYTDRVCQLYVHVYLSFCSSQCDLNQSSTICTSVMQLPHNNYPNFGEFVTNSKCDICMPLFKCTTSWINLAYYLQYRPNNIRTTIKLR